MTKHQRKELCRFIAAGVLFAAFLIFLPENPVWLNAAVYIALYFFVGWDVLSSAVKNVLKGQMLDEKFLMTVASVGAMCLTEFHEGVAVMLFYQVGEWFQDFAVDRSRKSIEELLKLCPEEAIVIRDGKEIIIPPDEVAIGDHVLVRPGDRVPVDGVVLSGAGSLDTSALTGESAPADIGTGDEVLSGSINLSGVLTLRCTRSYENSTVSKILDMVENATDQKAPVENFITRFSRIYTPAVVGLALILALVPPLFTPSGFGVWIHRALTFLVVSCPCALVVSVPLTFFSSIGSASRRGILVKGAQSLERIAVTDVIAFDKTGTLTQGRFTVTEVLPEGISKERLLEIAAHTEAFSTHPIAQSILKAYQGPLLKERIGDVREISGRGITAVIDGKRYYAGNLKLLNENGISTPDGLIKGLYAVNIADEKNYLGCLVIEDVLKENTGEALKNIRSKGIRKHALLTGDTKEAAERIVKGLEFDVIESHLLPGDKVDRIARLREGGHVVCFVGDGMNDAPVLTAADVGIAMGGLGSDAAIEAADIVLLNDSLEQIPVIVGLSKKTMRIVRENIIFSLGSKLIVLITGALGITGMHMAVFADVGVLCLCVLNALRTLRKSAV